MVGEHGCGDLPLSGHCITIRLSSSISLLFEFDAPNDLAVDSARNAVLELEVHLGNGVLGENGGIRNITYPMKKKTESAMCS